MSILQITTDVPGLVGVNPSIIYINTNDTPATVTTAGYVNKFPSIIESYPFNDFQMALITTVTANVPSNNWYQVQKNGVTGVITFVAAADTITGNLNVSGTITAGGTIQSTAGNLIAGSSGHAGNLQSFPATAARGHLAIVGANSAGDTVTTITNASQAAARTYTIPDGGADSSFIITNSGGTQTIATGNLTLTAGNITATAGNIAATAGNVTAGALMSAGTTITAGTGITSTTGNITATAGNYIAGNAAGPNAGNFQSFPAASGGANDKLVLSATTSGGNFTTTITNAAMGQATTFTLPDPGGAAANFILNNSGGTQTIATGNLTLTAGNITATAGNITATAGSLSAGTTVTAGTGITATTGNIVATTGNITASAGTITASQGNITAGSNTHAAGFISFPAGNNLGFLQVSATNNSANSGIILTNGAFSQNTTISITDVGNVTTFINPSLINSTGNPVAALITVDTNLTFGGLATAGTITLQASSGAKQFKIRNMFLSRGTNFSGGGGDRNIQVTDGTTVYSVMPAANIQASTGWAWGGTGLPLPASAAVNTSSVAGQNIRAAYQGGTTDYTAGSLPITVLLERVA